jgi:hypothetical protein
VYSVMIASRLSAAATIKTIVNSVAHMVDAPRFPDTDLKAGHQLKQKYGTHLDTRDELLPFYFTRLPFCGAIVVR